MAHAIYGLNIEQNADFQLYMTWTSGGVAVNLTGYRLRLQIRSAKDSTVKAVDFDSNALTAGLTLGTALGASGVIDIRFSSAVTAALDFGDRPYKYDLLAVSPGGAAYKLMAGNAILAEGVTR